MSSQKIPIILDGDPGHDDAIAWMLAQASPELEIRAVTSCAGNQTIQKTTYNAQRVCTLLGITAPIAMGSPHPLLADPITAGNIHGQTGLDGPALPEPGMELSSLGAVELMAKVLRESEEPVTIIATGPQTNVAALLLAHPELKSKIGRISLMGGGIAYGNWTPAAEFNILVDPEAADVEFRSGLPIQMCGLDVTLKAYLTPEETAEIAGYDSPVCRFFGESTQLLMAFHEKGMQPGLCLHDVCPVLFLTQPELFQGEEAGVYVETRGSLTSGKTVTDLWSDKQFPEKNAFVVLDVDRQGFAAAVRSALLSY